MTWWTASRLPRVFCSVHPFHLGPHASTGRRSGGMNITCWFSSMQRCCCSTRSTCHISELSKGPDTMWGKLMTTICIIFCCLTVLTTNSLWLYSTVSSVISIQKHIKRDKEGWSVKYYNSPVSHVFCPYLKHSSVIWNHYQALMESWGAEMYNLCSSISLVWSTQPWLSFHS